MTRLMALYPATWRARYEDEFLALIEQRPPDLGDRVDIVRGAIDARLRPQVVGDPESEPSRPDGWGLDRRLGWLTLTGGVLWIAAFLVAINGPTVTNEYGTYQDGSGALPLLFVSLVCLGLGMSAVASRLPTSATFARAAAIIGALSGIVWSVSPWNLMFAAVAWAGLLIVAVAAWRAGQWGRLDLAILGFSTLAGSFLLGVALLTDLRELVVPVWACAGLTWVAVGHALVRSAPRSDDTLPETTGS